MKPQMAVRPPSAPPARFAHFIVRLVEGQEVAQMDVLGNMGWRLVAVSAGRAYFVRQEA